MIEFEPETIKSSGGSDINLKLINDNRQLQINIDIAGHEKTMHWHKRGLKKLIDELTEAHSKMVDY